MHSRRLLVLVVLILTAFSGGQTPSSSSSSSPATTKPSHTSASHGPASIDLDSGGVSNGVYRNRALGLTCQVPDGWVLRTSEMNARDDANKDDSKDDSKKDDADPPAVNNGSASSTGAKVLLAAFSRPPEAKGGEVNASILIAAESAAAYPGLTEAAQYFFPLTEIAKAQGFEPDEDPYAVEIGTRQLVRGDFHKNLGSRVMHQSTLALLSHGYAVSITVIGGSDDEVAELIEGLSFTMPAK
jgi:hypothetical protein